MSEQAFVPVLDTSPELLPLGIDVGHMARDLNALFKLCRSINSQPDLESLQRTVLKLIFEVVPADFGAVLIIDSVERQPTSTVIWSREGGQLQDIEIQRELVLKALWERSEVVADVSANEKVLCIPLIAMQKAIGVIYLVRLSPCAPFPEDTINFAVSVATIAAVTLENVLTVESVREENQQLRQKLAGEEHIIGETTQMRHLTETVAKVAKGDAPVLILGESGVGKEIVARAIHQSSARAAQPFIAINCAAIPDTLIESELFGHEKGAFTGAVASQRGKFEIAAGGTVFLDEIGELEPRVQAKLLRVLQEKEFERIGGRTTLRFCARVLAATNKDLVQAIEAHQFRQDLFFRLNVLSVTVPPLRERRQDIPLLAMHFARKYSQRLGRPFKGISPSARAALMNYSWPGNVRELENAIEHAMVMGSSDVIVREDLPDMLRNEEIESGTGAYQAAVANLKRQLVREAMTKSGGNCTQAARLLGVHPKYLHRLIRKLEVTSGAV
jgi:transcriptional regulator with GAF, ATPase, and Fis domain